MPRVSTLPPVLQNAKAAHKLPLDRLSTSNNPVGGDPRLEGDIHGGVESRVREHLWVLNRCSVLQVIADMVYRCASKRRKGIRYLAPTGATRQTLMPTYSQREPEADFGR